MRILLETFLLIFMTASCLYGFYLPLDSVFTKIGLENGEQENPGWKPHALSLTSYHDQGFSRLATYMTSIPEYSNSLSMNNS